MTNEKYTPGYTENSVQFMADRTFEKHGAFAAPYLDRAKRILDCGCGPGSITCGLAKMAPHAEIIGIDADQSQASLATEHASQHQLQNVSFQSANIYELPFADGQFDLVMSHALFEHLVKPENALKEVKRVLSKDGVAAICSPDWSGFLLAPSIPESDQAIECYMQLQLRNGGDVFVGRKSWRLSDKCVSLRQINA